MGRRQFSVFVFICLIISSQTRAGEFRNGLGGGIQYGGIIGWQGSYNTENNKFRMSYGYRGFTFGYDRYLGSHFSLGGQIFVNQFRVGSGLSLNYYLSTHGNSGWILGLDAYRGYRSGEAAAELIIDAFEFVFDTGDAGFSAKIENGLAVSVGYQF